MSAKSGKDMLTSENKSSIDTYSFSECNSLVVIEETKGIQSNNEVMKSQCKSPCAISAFPKNEISSLTAIDLDISESRVHPDKTESVSNNTISNVHVIMQNPNIAKEHVNEAGNESIISEIYLSDNFSHSHRDVCNENILVKDDKFNVGLLTDNGTFVDANKKTNNENPEHECVCGLPLSSIKYVFEEVKGKKVNNEQKSTNLGEIEEILDVSSDADHAVLDLLQKFDCAQLKPPSVGQSEETLDPPSGMENVVKDENEVNLKCSECGEVVELLNNSVTFSLEVHCQIHKALSESNDFSSKTSYDKNFDYVCPDCNSVIAVFNNDIDLSFERHFSDCQPKSVAGITPKERIKMNLTFVDEVFNCLGNAFNVDIPFIIFEGGSLFCTVCKCTIDTSKDICNTSISLHTHLRLLYHKDLVSLLKETEKTLAGSEKPSKESLVGEAQNVLNNSQRGKENCESKFTNNKVTKQLSSLKDNVVPGGSLAEQCENTFDVSRLFKYIPERYKIHQEFFSSSQEGVYCIICSNYVEPSKTHLKRHIIHISHKIAFFKQIKEKVKNEQKPHVKFLIIIDNQLYCSYCKVVVTSITSLESVCKSVVWHFQNSFHSDKMKGSA